jgi:FecR protein
MKTHNHLADRTRVVALSIALVLSVVPVIVVAQNSTQPGIGIVEFLDGDVAINGVPADFGQLVEFGDWVQTGPDSLVDIVFDRANIFRLGENTVATIEIGTTRQSVNLRYGSLAAVFNRLRTLSGRGTFAVRTPTVAGGVRGTSFFIRVIDSTTTYVCACNGTLELDPEGPSEAFLDSATDHSAHYFRESNGTVTVQTAPLVYHSSEGLNKIADQIGVTIPWGTLPE